MPWKVVTAVEHRKALIEALQSEDSPGLAALCREQGISRKTAYKWIGRWKASGEAGLEDRPRASLSHPNALGEEMEALVVGARHAHPSWGAKKLLPWLQRRHPGRDDWPCLSSVSAVLERNQLVRRRRARRTVAPFAGALASPGAPNDLWAIDHKGWWTARNGDRCEPFTVTDSASRFLIRCVIGGTKGFPHVRGVLEGAFREFGLPEAVRSDNGPPFASRAPLGLSPLSVWLLRLGVGHERIQAGKPEQNGAHERMHRTMMADGAGRAVGATARQEQRRLNAWREEFNSERPHEALGFATPASCYGPSPREMPRRLPEFEYPAALRVRKVDRTGKVCWRGRDVFLTEALQGQWLGFEAEDDGRWSVWLGRMGLGHFDEGSHRMAWAKTMTPRRQ